jgi:hypothetical protein
MRLAWSLKGEPYNMDCLEELGWVHLKLDLPA